MKLHNEATTVTIIINWNMGHCIDALIAQKPVNEEKAKELGLALIYESEFVIIPLIEENIYYFEIENNIESEDFGEEICWDCTTIIEIAKYLEIQKYVIASLYDRFIGSYYEEKNKLMHEVSINSALHLIGVPKKNDSEFIYLNLNAYRNAEFYYMDEIVGHKDTSNIIKGRTLYPNYNKN